MSNLDGVGKGEVASDVDQPASCTSCNVPRGFSQSRLTSLTPLLVAAAIITFVLVWLRLDVFGGAENAAGNTHTLRVATAVVPSVSSEGSSSRRRAMAGIAPRRDRDRDRASAAEEPTGFVFEETTMERENSLRAADLLAAAGEPILVLDGAEDLKDTIHRCTQRGGCDSANAILEVRARVAEIVRKGLAQPSASPSATGHSGSSGVPTDGVNGDETLDHLFLWSGVGETEMNGGPGVARECYGGFDTEQRARVVKESSRLLAAASPGTVEERGEGCVHEEVREYGTNIGEDTPAYLERGAAWCGPDGWGVDTGAESRRFEEDAGSLGVRVGGMEEDGFSIRPAMSSEGGGTSDAEDRAVVVALSGWNADEIEALLQAYPGTPWLYLCGELDGNANSCQQNRHTATATRLLSRPTESSEGVVLPSSSLTAAAAARVLTRLFGVKLSPVGELGMAELYARQTSAEAESSLDVATEAAAVAAPEPPLSSSLEGRARPSEDACRELREASANSTKVLGGPFDPAWWWGPEENTERKSFGNEHHEKQEGNSCRDSEVGGTPERSGSSTGVLAADVDADAGGSDAGVVFGQRWRFHEAAAGGGDGGSSGSGGPQGESRDGGIVESLPSAAVGAKRERDPLELGAAAPLEGEGVDGEGARRRWQWQRGLRRMVDSESFSWMSSEVYSEPLESFPCSDVPGADYPSEWPLLDLLENWNPRNASAVPPRHYLGVCRFDYQTELHKARAYGFSEVPFIVYNVPELDRAVQEWSDPVKLAAALENHLYSIDVSSTNRFLYYGESKLERPPGWTPPTWRIMGTFGSWLLCALGACEDMDQPQAEYDLPDKYTDPSGMASDQSLDLSLDRSPDPSLEQFHPDESISNSETFRAKVSREGGGGAVGATPPGSKRHYYLKLSSTLQRPNRFVDRSLPFFVPSARSREIVDDDHDVGPADGDYTPSKKGHRRKSSEKSRWADKEYRRQHLGERLDGDTIESAGVSGGAKQQQQEEEGTEGGKGGDSINIFLRDASAMKKGIHCRLGMDGVMSDGHYDGSRNMVALLAGKRRWILSSPKNCGHMHMFRKGHPSARHTSADWTDPEVAQHSPNLAKATANEVILRAGEALYVPEHWIHSIVNIGVSAQCNSRSGKSNLYHSIVQECEASARAE